MENSELLKRGEDLYRRCENKCMLTITKFEDGQRYITGNRCEKGAGKTDSENELPNLYEYPS